MLRTLDSCHHSATAYRKASSCLSGLNMQWAGCRLASGTLTLLVSFYLGKHSIFVHHDGFRMT